MWSKWFGKKKKEAQPTPAGETATDVQLDVVILSDLGMIRTNNEDMGLFVRNASEEVIRRRGYLLVVADGMGGHQAGEVASKMAAETVSEEYFHSSGKTGIEKSLEEAFHSANDKIFSLSSSNASYRGMGTTCTAVAIIGDQLYYGHAGDSRAYLVKNGIVTQVTQDHTYVRELVNAGEITKAEAARHPKRNILTNAMGTKPTLRIDTGLHPAAFNAGDRILLCSDGLYDYITDNEFAEILAGRSLQEAAETMVSEAKRRGGHDNITVLIAGKSPATTTAARETRDIEIPKSIHVPQTKETELP